MNPISLLLSKLALNDGKKDHVGEKTRQSGGEPCAYFPSLSASVFASELEPAGFWPAEEAKHAVVMEHRSQLPTRWRAFRSLMDAEVDLQALGLVDAAQHARLARERLEEDGLEA